MEYWGREGKAPCWDHTYQFSLCVALVYCVIWYWGRPIEVGVKLCYLSYSEGVA